MFALVSNSSYSETILQDEVTQAIDRAKSAIVEGTLKGETAKLYAVKNSNCGKRGTAVLCTYLYAYALENWNSTGYNYITEKQLNAILSCVERTSKTCCNGV